MGADDVFVNSPQHNDDDDKKNHNYLFRINLGKKLCLLKSSASIPNPILSISSRKKIAMINFTKSQMKVMRCFIKKKYILFGGKKDWLGEKIFHLNHHTSITYYTLFHIHD
jgi:hypothetical protein